MSDTDHTPLPANLRMLRILVMVLMIVMIGGFLTIVGLFVMRFSEPAKEPLKLPEQVKLPEDFTPQSVTMGEGWFLFVSRNGQILIFNEDGTLRQSLTMAPDGVRADPENTIRLD